MLQVARIAITLATTRGFSRLTVPPASTGLRHLSGRGDVDFDGRVELESLLDLKILNLTPMRVLWGRGLR
jgi:hypothetical protein